MNRELVILIAEDDLGHAALVRKNILRAGINNKLLHFNDGQELLDFLFRDEKAPHRKNEISYLILLDIRMPKVNGIEALRKLKEHAIFKRVPVVMLTTTDDPREIQKCYELGCSNYIRKPVDYENFVDVIKKLGLFLKVVEVPTVQGVENHAGN